MKTIVLFVFPLLALSSFVAAQTTAKPVQAAKHAPKDTEMRQAATTFLSVLSAEQRKKITYSFADDERFNWHFIPRDRKGVPIREMNEKQRKAAIALLQTTLSEKGLHKVQKIMEMEVILKALEGLPPKNDRRHPEKYYFTLFGTPTRKGVWGWRIEGHHVSLHFSSATGRIISSTPAFMGSNPAIVPEGPHKGKQILKQEADLGFALLRSFSPEQLKKVLINEVAPSEIVTGNSRKAMMNNPEGIHFAEMTLAQQQLFKQLLELYLQNYQKELADDLRWKVEKAGMDQMHFAWAGHREPVAGKAYYYRVHGPVLLIEYDNSQNNANHVHTVIRDLTNDFGEDALREHYRRHKHQK